MVDESQEAFERDIWEMMPPKSSFARMHQSLLMSPRILKRQQTRYEHKHSLSNIDDLPSPTALHKIQSNASDGSPLTIIKEHHITPDWYHLTLQKILSTSSSLSNKLYHLERQQSTMINFSDELQETTQRIHRACQLRDKWIYKNQKNNGHIGSIINYQKIKQQQQITINNTSIIEENNNNIYSFQMKDGIGKIYKNNTTSDHSDDNEIFVGHSFDEYLCDLQFIYKLMAFGPAKTLSYTRLKILQRRFQLHLLLNRDVELTESSSVPYRDFYNVRKIDNNIHLSAGMHQKHLLQFILNKYQKDYNRIVSKDNKTLSQIFDELNINVHHLSVDKLDVHAQQSTFQRFDKFDNKYNPVGEKTLRTLFLKIDNYINGEYLAEITKECINDLEKQRYQYVEYRLTVQGNSKLRWNIIANWICKYNLFAPNVRWIIQIPRIYTALKKTFLINSFHDMMCNIFEPLFEVTLNPSINPSLHLFLQTVVGIDCVGDESMPHKMKINKYPSPKEWIYDNKNPPYMYYLYYIYINLYKLNKLREELGLNTFALRPQCGEAGSVNHLAAAFLLSHSINHGIRLYYTPILQYLYYLQQIGISVSPLSNNILFQQYDKNPFPRFFQRGLNISLSTDNPLLIHYTKDALLEEYSIAAQVYSLSAIDLCEIARNSVVQCGWDVDTKKDWIGYNYYDKKGAKSNDIYRTNVPDARIQFRYFLLEEEQTFIKSFGLNILSKSKHFMGGKLPYLHHIDEDDEENENLKHDASSCLFQTPPVKTRDNIQSEDMPNKINYSFDMLFGMMDSLKSAPKISETDDNQNNVLIDTPFGSGKILKDNDKHYIVELNTMICSVLKSQCNIIHDNDDNDDDDMDEKNEYLLEFRNVSDNDMTKICELEMAASNKTKNTSSNKKELCYRYIFEKEYFKVMTLNENVIGFVCGKKDIDYSLCIDFVVIDNKYLLNGYGTQMMRSYMDEQTSNAQQNQLKIIKLCCPKNLILFFENIGFKLISKCQIIEHEKNSCFQMTIDL